MKMTCSPLLFSTLAVCLPMAGQHNVVTGNSRVDHLLEVMTLDEKLALVHGAQEDPATYQGQAGYLPGIPRLGIPPMRFADGPPGILTRVPSTALPATMALAATFSRQDAEAIGTVIGNEARSHGIAVALQPFINIDRDFTFARSYNTFGEDPFLTGELGAAEIRGIQAKGVMAQAKHFIGYDTNGTNVAIDEQTLHEIYAAPFEAAVHAGVASIMCSYNRINGEYACGNHETLTQLLRKQLDFHGFMTSDWGAVHATNYIQAGTDIEMPGPLSSIWAYPSYFVNGKPLTQTQQAQRRKLQLKALSDAGLPEEPPREDGEGEPDTPVVTDMHRLLAQGSIAEDTITQAAARVLLQMDRFGLLDGKDKLDITPSDIEGNARTNQKTAEDAAVLLKNTEHILPLKPSKLEDVVLIGPGANQTIAVGMASEKAVGLPDRAIGALSALKQLAHYKADIKYAVANDMEGVPVPAKLLTHNKQVGLSADVSNLPPSNGVQYTIHDGTALPPDSQVTWSGEIEIPEAGTYRLHLQLLGCLASLTIDGQLVARNSPMWIHGDITQAAQDNVLPMLDGLDNVRVAVPLTAGQHKISVNVEPDSSHAPTQIRLNWVTPKRQLDVEAKAIDAARHAHTAIVFVWSRSRPAFALPGDQDDLIRRVAEVNPNTVVVMNVSQPVAMPWLPKVKSVLQMWWPGDEGGWATARLLLGQVSPAGRLPFTWPKKLSDIAALDPSHPERSGKGTAGTTTFSEGVLVGYRWFDATKTEPLFPFGFGLSYSQFSYSRLKLYRDKSGGIAATLTITNTGDVASDEVAQIYVNKPDKSPLGVQFAESILGGFERVNLKPHTSQRITLHVPLRQLQYWSTTTQAWVTPKGQRELWVGGTSRDYRRSAEFSIK